jgi:hypothetical protein
MDRQNHEDRALRNQSQRQSGGITLAARQEFIDRVEKIAIYPAGDAASIRDQLKTLASCVLEINKHQRELDQQISSLIGMIQNLSTPANSAVVSTADPHLAADILDGTSPSTLWNGYISQVSAVGREA